MKELYGIRIEPWTVLKHSNEARMDKPQSEWMCGATIYRDSDDKRELVAHVANIKESDLSILGHSPELLRLLFSILWNAQEKDGNLVLPMSLFDFARKIFRSVLDDAGVGWMKIGERDEQ